MLRKEPGRLNVILEFIGPAMSIHRSVLAKISIILSRFNDRADHWKRKDIESSRVVEKKRIRTSLPTFHSDCSCSIP